MKKQLFQDETEGVAVGLPKIHCEEELARAAYCRNQVDPLQPFTIGDLVLLLLLHPATDAMVSKADD